MTFVAAALGGALGYGVAGTLGGAAIGAGIGGMIGGGMNQAQAAQQGAQTQYQGTLAGIDAQQRMFDIINQQQAPYREAGYGALNQIQTMLPYFTKVPTAEDLRALPGFQFGLEQGTGAARQNVNVGGGGSNVTRAAQKFAEDYATSIGLPAYQNLQTNIYNRLSNLAGLGQVAQGQTTQAGLATGQNLASLATGGATALAGGQIGAANALAGTTGQLGNAGLMYSLLRPGGGGGGGTPSGLLDWFATT
jgi:hypothetical protein